MTSVTPTMLREVARDIEATLPRIDESLTAIDGWRYSKVDLDALHSTIDPALASIETAVRRVAADNSISELQPIRDTLTGVSALRDRLALLEPGIRKGKARKIFAEQPVGVLSAYEAVQSLTRMPERLQNAANRLQARMDWEALVRLGPDQIRHRALEISAKGADITLDDQRLLVRILKLSSAERGFDLPNSIDPQFPLVRELEKTLTTGVKVGEMRFSSVDVQALSMLDRPTGEIRSRIKEIAGIATPTKQDMHELAALLALPESQRGWIPPPITVKWDPKHQLVLHSSQGKKLANLRVTSGDVAGLRHIDASTSEIRTRIHELVSQTDLSPDNQRELAALLSYPEDRRGPIPDNVKESVPLVDQLLSDAAAGKVTITRTYSGQDIVNLQLATYNDPPAIQELETKVEVLVANANTPAERMALADQLEALAQHLAGSSPSIPLEADLLAAATGVIATHPTFAATNDMHLVLPSLRQGRFLALIDGLESRAIGLRETSNEVAPTW